jgi:hypothetical protein
MGRLQKRPIFIGYMTVFIEFVGALFAPENGQSSAGNS